MDAADTNAINRLVIDRMAAETARLREALEQARKENGKLGRAVDAALSGEEGDHAAIRIENSELRAQRDQAQKDAKDARALLEMMVTQNTYAVPLDWRSRIEAMLEQKP